MPKPKGKKKAAAPASLQATQQQSSTSSARTSPASASASLSASVSAPASSSPHTPASASASASASAISPASATATPPKDPDAKQGKLTRSHSSDKNSRKQPDTEKRDQPQQPEPSDQSRSISKTTHLDVDGASAIPARQAREENPAQITPQPEEKPAPPSRPKTMDSPVRDITAVVKALIMGTDKQFDEAVMGNFLPDAELIHPWVRVPSFSDVNIPGFGTINSRSVISAIYRFARSMSVRTEVYVNSAAFDPRANMLHLYVHQVVKAWFIPYHSLSMDLGVVLRLVPCPVSENGLVVLPGPHAPRLSEAASDGQAKKIKYMIASQEDLFQLNVIIGFLLPGIGYTLYYGIQCLLSVLVLLVHCLTWPFIVLANQTGLRPERRGI